MEDSDIPRAPIDPAKLTPEVIAHVHYKVLQIVWGGILRLAPLATLLIVGLAEGLLIAIPVYLMVRVLCVQWRLWRSNEILSRKQRREIPALLAGGASIVTQNPIWFQMEIPALFAIGVVAWATFRRPILKDADFPFPVEMVGDGPYRLLRALFLSTLVVFTALLFALAFYEYPTAWLLVRTLGLFGGLVTLSALSTWLAARKANRDAEGMAT